MSQGLNILQFFQFEHLPKDLQAVSRPFCHLAQDIATCIPSNPERSVALRKLLEAKDAAVRAAKFVERKKDVACTGMIDTPPSINVGAGSVIPLRHLPKSTENGVVWGSKESLRAAGRKEDGFYGVLNDKENSITPVRFHSATRAGLIADTLDFAMQWSGYNRLVVTEQHEGNCSEPTYHNLVNGGWLTVDLEHQQSAPMSVADVVLNGDAG